mgnify:CR=1 FL=1
MSVLDRPPHVVTVYPVVETDDGYGGVQPGEGEPVECRVYCAPLSPDEGSAEGYPAETRWQVIARRLPAGAWARVVWQGESYVVVTEPRRFAFSRRTAHDVAVIRRG